MPVSGPQAPLCLEGGLKLSPSSYGLASALRQDRHKDAAVWRAYHCLKLPPGDLEFIFTSLWKKLAVGERLHQIFPRIPDTCPLCGAVEGMYHGTKACAWLMTLVRVLTRAVQSTTGTAPNSRLCSDYPALSLVRAPGLLL